VYEPANSVPEQAPGGEHHCGDRALLRSAEPGRPFLIHQNLSFRSPARS
jgi:hypothetical protein